MELELATDRSLVRAAGHSTRFLQVRMRAPLSAQASARQPVDLALVLDRSGSMGGDKWRCARAAAEESLTRLEARDQAALVVYDDQVDTLLPLSPATLATRHQVHQALAQIRPRGTTNLSGGWLTGCGLIGTASADDRLRRCFLLTDGLANTGITDPRELTQHARELRKRGVVTHTFGVGEDFDEALLGPLADAGGGHFQFLRDAKEIGPLLARELGDALEVVCPDLRVWVRWQAALQVEPLSPWSHEATAGALCVWAGDLVSGQEQELLFALRFPQGTPEASCPVQVEVTDAQGQILASGAISWTWAEQDANDCQPRDRAVDRRVAQFHANRARQEASQANRRGDLKLAREQLRQVAKRILGYAGEDPELLGLANTLVQEAEQHREQLSAVETKARYFAATSMMKGRSATGERRRQRDPNDPNGS